MYFSIISALLLLLSLVFQWDIIDALTPFLGGPLLGLVWLLVVISAVLGSAHAYRHRSKGASAFAPLMVSIGTLLVAFFVPFTQLWLYANFNLNKVAREQVVEKVKSGTFAPNVAHNDKLIALPTDSGVSMGGDEILVEGPSSNPYVFFFTFRGILDNYSGFLWVPDGGRPEQFGDAGEPGTEIESFGGNWYFIGNR
ncbi:hypothetical protein [Thioalbus denitrificans]|uniref:hypothetical protein n=1 Tax=Thioalbus denitrificans TaxID=547122 RepID=UPI001B86E5B1|nr:hypothetical protein [Thioalbus denitrificans]